jgi:hypothetical protein
VLNLPEEKHSHGLRKVAAVEATRGSFDQTVEAIGRATGVGLGKRQVQDLTAAAGSDVDQFYSDCQPASGSDGDVLVLSCDGKGIVVRPEALRDVTRKAATSRKLATRLSKARSATASA